MPSRSPLVRHDELRERRRYTSPNRWWWWRTVRPRSSGILSENIFGRPRSLSAALLGLVSSTTLDLVDLRKTADLLIKDTEPEGYGLVSSDVADSQSVVRFEALWHSSMSSRWKCVPPNRRIACTGAMSRQDGSYVGVGRSLKRLMRTDEKPVSAPTGPVVWE